jgi:DNA invertase Pin-like site-specific DNA recombinase
MEQVGYARVFLREERQVLDRQMDALKAAGCRRVFDDRGSGASTDRPGLRACLDYLRLGDVLVVLDLDRLGRLAGELVHLLDGLEARDVGFRALNASFDTMTPMGRAFLQVQVAFAEMERSVIHQRVKEGIAARTVGRKRGRPRLMTPERLRHAQHLMADRNRSIPAICRELGGMPASTLYHYLRADGTLKAPGIALLGTEPPAVNNPPLDPGLAHETLLIFSPVLICSPF